MRSKEKSRKRRTYKEQYSRGPKGHIHGVGGGEPQFTVSAPSSTAAAAGKDSEALKRPRQPPGHAADASC